VSKGQHGFGAARFGRPPAPKPIGRPALLARLDTAPWLTLVVAGPGAGKSTLLNTWSAARHGRLVELGPLLAAGAAGAADLRSLLTPAVTTLVVDGLETLPAGSPLLHDLAALCARPPAGWRAAEPPRPGLPPAPPPAAPAPTAGSLVAGALPAGFRLVLASREPLPFPVGAALRLGDGELAFAEDETYQVLAASFADAAAADALAPDLHLLTNGWPELVGLAAAWLAQHAVGERGLRLGALGRTSGPLRERLVAAILDGLNREDRELVWRLAYLPGVDAATADRLDLTEHLVAVPPFVQPMPGRAGWFAVPNGLKDPVRRALPMSAEAREALLAAYQSGM
jgi:ATP/maltotriose-dependent transcriptional regulator MalT